MTKEVILQTIDIKSFYTAELPSLKTNGNGQAIALCPFHDDQKASLSVNLETGLYYCHACNEKGDIFTFYQKRRNLDFKQALRELAQQAGISVTKSKIVATYNYTDQEGNLFFQTVRFSPKDFKQRRPDGKGGWVYNLNGIQLIPYNLPDLVKSNYCLVVEGEKDVETLKSLGFVASCNPMGAGKWRADFNEYFRAKRIYIIPDNDKPGREHALQVAKNLNGIASLIKIVELNGLPEKGDISDWIAIRKAEGKTDDQIKEELTELIETAPEAQTEAEIRQGRLKLTGIADMLNAEPVKYLIDKILIKDTLTMLSAYAATGKSLLSLAIAKSILTGESLFDYFTVSETGSVLLIDEENPASFIKERLQGFGFTAEMPLYFLHYQGIKLDNDSLFNELLKLIEDLKPKLVIIDSLIRVHNQKENEAGMAHIMQRLRQMVLRGTTVLIIHHHRKGAGDIKEGIRGHSDIIGGVDAAITLEQKDDYLLLSHAKSRTVLYNPIRLELQTSGNAIGFKCLGDEDGEITEAIYNILSEHPEGMKQSEIRQIMRDLDYGDKKIRQTLKKGEGFYWEALKGDRNATIYKPLNSVWQFGKHIYMGQTAKLEVVDREKIAKQDNLNSTQSLDNLEFGSLAEGLKSDCQTEIVSPDIPIFIDAEVELL